MSYDPRVVLQITTEDWSNIDMAALESVTLKFYFSILKFKNQLYLYFYELRELLGPVDSVSWQEQLVSYNNATSAVAH